MKKLELDGRGHWVVDGQHFPTVATVFGSAQARGYTGTEACIRDRLAKGAKTWADLLRPVSEAKTAASRATLRKRHDRRKSERDEMAALMADLDKRRASIGYDY